MTSILVVDDSEGIVDGLVSLLCIDGHDARGARSSAEALAVALDFPFDIAAIDLYLPELDGITLMQTLKTLRPGACFVFFTAYAPDPLMDEAALLSGQKVLQKPYLFDAILQLATALK